MPSTLRFLLIILVLTGVVYAAAWLLASFPPEPAAVVRTISHGAFR
ncbi:MAG TPA: histidine kinase [Thermopetrobacter sp.]|nr:histidine kinase [Thermopetrobacter sp.]